MSAALAALPPTLSDYQPGSCLRAAGGADAMYGRNLALLRRGQTLLELLASIRAGFGHVADMNRSYAGGIHPGGGRMFDQVMAGAPAALLDWLRARGQHSGIPAGRGRSRGGNRSIADGQRCRRESITHGDDSGA